MSPPVDWKTEPVVSSYVRLLYKHPRSGADIPVPVCSTPAIITNVGVVVAGYDGGVRLFSPDLQKLYWQLKLRQPVYASVVFDSERHRIIVSDTSGMVVSLNLSGEVIWTASLGSAIYATPAVLPGPDILAVACFEGRCAGVNLASGQIVFEAVLPKPWFAKVAPVVARRDPYASPVASPTGHILICAADTVSNLDPTGQVSWRRVLNGTIRSSPVVLAACGVVVVACVDGSCTFLDCSTGDEMGSVSLGDKITASLAGVGTIAAVGTASGKVFGLDGDRRTVIWSEDHGSPFEYSSFTVLPDGTFICTNALGNVIARNWRDGRFLWETSQLLGVTELAPRVDITPIADPEGFMYGASYMGAVYRYRFRPIKRAATV
jgi:outer membrane protein assembly factor BamB